MNYSLQMLEALEKQDLAKAQEMFLVAIRKDDEQTLLSLAQELEYLGFNDEAKTIYEKVLITHPEYDELYLSLAGIAIDDDKLDQAFEYLEKIPKTSESYVAALVAFADLYQVLEIPEVSEAKLQEARMLAPDELLIHLALAELYFSVGKNNEAIELYTQMDAKEVKQVTGISVYERIGVAYSLDGHFEVAVGFLEKAYEDAQQENQDLLYHLGMDYYQLKDYQKALRYLEKLADHNPEYPNMHYIYAKSLVAEERLDEADKILANGVKNNPYNALIYQFASEISYRLKDVGRAEDYLLEAITLDDLRDENLYRLMNLYWQENRLEDVLRAYQEMELPEHPQANWLLGKTYNEKEEYEKAQEHFEVAYNDLKDEPEFLKEYALFLREEGKVQEAQKLVRRALNIQPEDLELQSLLEEL